MSLSTKNVAMAAALTGLATTALLMYKSSSDKMTRRAARMERRVLAWDREQREREARQRKQEEDRRRMEEDRVVAKQLQVEQEREQREREARQRKQEEDRRQMAATQAQQQRERKARQRKQEEDRQRVREAAQQQAADDRFASVDVASYALLDFQSSNFKAEYERMKAFPLLDGHQGRIVLAVQTMVDRYCHGNGISRAAAQVFSEQLVGQGVHSQDVRQLCSRVWTSVKTLQRRDGTAVEFCSIFSCIMREDRASLARVCAIFARGLKTNVVACGGGRIYPPNGQCWRGGGFDDKCRGFFVRGKQYRVPSFLSTTTVKQVSARFQQQAQHKGQPVVEWQIEFDPRGEHDQRYRCMHVNHLLTTDVPDEIEHLFPAFSAFTVVGVQWSGVTPATVAQPHRIVVRAATDNKAVPEDLPLAPWS
jgi:hypothetical protein